MNSVTVAFPSVGKPLPLASSSLLPPSLGRVRCCSSHDAPPDPPSPANDAQFSSPPPLQQPSPPRPRTSVDTTDWVASSLTRRFGLGAGLAWVGFLAFGVISEQIKTRTEVFLEEQGTRDVESAEEVVLPSKVRYRDLRVGGGASPHRGDLVVVDLVGKVQSTGQVFVDTYEGTRRSIAFVFGSKPYVGGMCKGLEEALQSMKVGGKRQVVVPSELGFGDSGEDFGGGVQVPPHATLEYTLQIQRASIAPS